MQFLKRLKQYLRYLKYEFNRNLIWSYAIIYGGTGLLSLFFLFSFCFDIYSIIQYDEWELLDTLQLGATAVLVYASGRYVMDCALEDKLSYHRMIALFRKNNEIAKQTPPRKRLYMLASEMQNRLDSSPEEDHEFIKRYYKILVEQATDANLYYLTADENDILDCMRIVFSEITSNPQYGYIYVKATIFPLFSPKHNLAVDGCILVHFYQKNKQIPVVLPLPSTGVFDKPVEIEGCYFGSFSLDDDDCIVQTKIDPYGLFLTSI